MRNLLKYSLLTLSILLMNGSSQAISAQPEVLRESYAAQTTLRQASIEILHLLEAISSYFGEAPLGNTHITSDLKSYIHHLFHAKYAKNITQSLAPFNLNRYFHPYSTLNKTKYYVFALRKIII